MEDAACKLLEQVTREDIGLLDEFQLNQLVKAVRLSTNSRFTAAAVRTLGCLGSHKTLQNLEVLLNDPFITKKDRSRLEPYVRNAMGELRIRLARERFSQPDFESDSSITPQIGRAARSVSNLGQEVSAAFMPPAEEPAAAHLANES